MTMELYTQYFLVITVHIFPFFNGLLVKDIAALCPLSIRGTFLGGSETTAQQCKEAYHPMLLFIGYPGSIFHFIKMSTRILIVLFFLFLITAENGPHLLVEAEQAKVFSHRGGNVTLPCKFFRDPTAFGSGTHKIRIKWTKLTSDYLKEVDVFVSMGYHKKAYGGYQGRVFLKGGSDNDASLVITDLTLEDYGKYKCEVIEGLEDDTAVVSLDLQGKYL